MDTRRCHHPYLLVALAAASMVSSAAAEPAAPVDVDLKLIPHVRASYVHDDEFGGRIYVIEGGAPSAHHAPLVLVHGLGDAGVRDFYPVLPALAEKRRIVAFDLPGFGRSTKANEEYTPARFAAVLRRVIDRHAGGAADVLGHSMGGAIAVMHAGSYANQVRKLVLVDAAGILHREAFVGEQVRTTFEPARADVPNAVAVVEAAADRLLRKGREFEPPPELLLKTAWLRKVTLGGEPGRISALALIATNFGAAIAAVRAPTIIVWGGKDHIAPVRTARLLVDRIADARLKVLDGVGHLPMKEAAAEMVAAVLNHLDGPAPAAAADEPRASQGDYMCEREHDFRITGRYDTITLDGCQRVSLLNVEASSIVMRDSSAQVVGSRIRTGMDVEGSTVLMTGGEIHGAPPLRLAASRLDLAGVKLSGGSHAADVARTSRVLCSVCIVESESGGVSHMHGERVLTPGQRHL